jgi:polysaccharide biosynthesis protein PslH
VRVLFLSTWFPYPPDNGSKLRANCLLRALLNRHAVTLVSFRSATDRHVPYPQTTGLAVVPVYDDPYRYTALPRVLKYVSPAPLAFFPHAVMHRAVTRLASSSDWDAVVAIQMPVAQYAPKDSRAARIIDVDTALTYQMRERLKRQRRALSRAGAWISWQKTLHYERKMLRHFDCATVVSAHETAALADLARGSGCHVDLIPNGVDCEHNRPGLVAHSLSTLVYNGSLTYSANYDAVRWFLAEIYPSVKAQIPGARVIITGSIDGVDLTKLPLDPSVKLTGFVEDVRMPVAGATVCMAPIRQGSGTRLKILEAMALGIPVVATAKAAEGLEIVDGEDLLIANDPSSFAQATTRLLTDKALRNRLAVSARRLVESRYDWQKIGDRFVKLVEGAAKRRGVST